MDDRDLLVRAREAFAAYRGLGREIVDDMISEIERLRTAYHRGVAAEREECAKIARAYGHTDGTVIEAHIRNRTI